MVFPSRMAREIAFNLGASRQVMDAGFDDAAELRHFMQGAADRAACFKLLSEVDVLIADGKKY